MKFSMLCCCRPESDDEEQKSKKKEKRGKKRRRKAKPESAAQGPLSNSCPKTPATAFHRTQEPDITINSAAETTLSSTCAGDTAVATDCAGSMLTSECTKEEVLTICDEELASSIYPAERTFTISAEETSRATSIKEGPGALHDHAGEITPVLLLTIGDTRQISLNNDDPEQPAVTIYCRAGPAVSIRDAEPAAAIDGIEEPPTTIINCATDEPAVTTHCSEDTLTTDCGEEAALISDCMEPALSITVSERPAICFSCSEKPAHSTDSTEETPLTIDCAEETFTVDCAEASALPFNSEGETAHAIFITVEMTPLIDCTEEPAVTTGCLEEPSLAFICAEEEDLGKDRTGEPSSTITGTTLMLSMDCTEKPDSVMDPAEGHGRHMDCTEETAAVKNDAEPLDLTAIDVMPSTANDSVKKQVHSTNHEEEVDPSVDNAKPTVGIDFMVEPVVTELEVAVDEILNPDTTINCATESALAITHSEEQAVNSYCTDVSLTMDSGRDTIHNSDEALPALTITSSEESAISVPCAEKPDPHIDCANETSPASDCAKVTLSIHCVEAPAALVDCEMKTATAITDAENVAPPVDCTEEQAVTTPSRQPAFNTGGTTEAEKTIYSTQELIPDIDITCPDLTTSCVEARSPTIICTETSTPIADCAVTPAIITSCAEKRTYSTVHTEVATPSIYDAEPTALPISRSEELAVNICCNELNLTLTDCSEPAAIHNNGEQPGLITVAFHPLAVSVSKEEQLQSIVSNEEVAPSISHKEPTTGITSVKPADNREQSTVTEDCATTPALIADSTDLLSPMAVSAEHADKMKKKKNKKWSMRKGKKGTKGQKMGSSTDSAHSPAEQGLALKIYCTEELGHTPVPVSHPITTLSEEAPVSIDGAKETACPISCAEEQTLITDGVAESAASISSTEEGVSASISAAQALTSTCSQSPHLTSDYADQNHQQTKKRRKGKNKMTLRSATLSDFSQEVAVLTLDPPDETPAQNIGHIDETPTQSLSYAEVVLACNVRSTGQTPAPNITCASAHNIRSAEQQASLRVKSLTPTIDCTRQQRLERLDSRTSQEDGEDQDATPRISQDYSVLGLPNIGNSCYMNATLQSLFSLPTFTQDIRGEEDFESSQLLKCLADLQAARSSSSRKQKTSLLRALKESIAADCSDFGGSEKQIIRMQAADFLNTANARTQWATLYLKDAHEFFSVLLCQLKEEQVSLRRTAGDLPCNRTIHSNFEFELRSTRTCLSCRRKLSQTELYTCLPLDLVPGGSIEDSLGLYFMGCEVECKCLWCPGHLASMEQELQSLPRVLVVQLKRFSVNTRGHLVKLHDRVRISPQLSLQPHSGATVGVPELPETHLTDAAPCAEAEKKTTLEGSTSIRVEDRHSMAEYRVTSVLSHIGSNMRHGHYICESRHRDKRWLSFDDEKVTELDQRTVLRRRSNSAYLLFYEFSGADERSRDEDQDLQ